MRLTDYVHASPEMVCCKRYTDERNKYCEEKQIYIEMHSNIKIVSEVYHQAIFYVF